MSFNPTALFQRKTFRRTKAGIAGLLAGFCLAATPAKAEVTYLDQGWGPQLRELFYYTPQGSRLAPLVWFQALPTLDGRGRFASAENLRQYGFLTEDHGADRGAVTEINTAGLPIGFAVDPVSQPGSGQWVGLTCAACHTGDVKHLGKTFRIDGGPAMLDFDRFLADLARTVRATAFNPQLRQVFVANMTGGETLPPAMQRRLEGELAAFASTLLGRAAQRAPVHPSGPGRVDALTQIVNSLAVVDLGEPDNYYPVGAPTSYPQLWLAPALEFVQWSPIAASPIARNAGEVLGVFGHASLRGTPETLFDSTARINELAKLEAWLEILKPPRWPEAEFGAIDEAKWRDGKALFDENCLGCHNMPPYRMTDPAKNAFGMQFIEISAVESAAVGTDPVYIQSLAGRLVKTGDLTHLLFDGKPAVTGAEFFLRTVGAVVETELAESLLPPEVQAKLNGFRFRPPTGPGERPAPYQPESLTALKAGPLISVWATGPYLHNGSVPSVYDLLSRPEDRPKTFFTGSRELDLEKLGFKSGGSPDRFKFDTTLSGNGNGGHAFPAAAPFDEAQKMAVIEYLKDPERFMEGTGQ